MCHSLPLEEVKESFSKLFTFRRKKLQLSVVSVQATNIPPRENVSYSKNTQTEESGGDAIPSRGSRLAGFDYYTLTYDDLDDGYEEDSLPGLGNKVFH